MNLLEKYIDEKNKYYIYGATSFGMYCYKAISEVLGEDKVEAFVESNPSVNIKGSKPVISPEQIQYQPDNVRIIVASVTWGKEMKDRLLELSIPDWKILTLESLEPYFRTLYAGDGIIESICLWPPITVEKGFLAEKISWFAPDRIEVIIFGETKDFKGSNIVVENVKNKGEVFDRVDKIYVWKAEEVNQELEGVMDKIHIVDPYFFLYIETYNYSKLYYRSFDQSQRRAMRQKSKEIFIQMREESKIYRKANLFCSGPSIQEAYDKVYEGEFNIVCNSMVKDRQFMKLLKPRAIAFTDVNYFLSPSDYCKQFLKDLMIVQKEYDSFIIVYEHEVALLLYHCPELEGRVIGMDNTSKEFVFPDENSLMVKPVSNIMSETMLPVASSLFDEIGIYGCTGRCPDENFFWQHNPNTQYHDLLQSVFDMYPSFFRDVGYADYYEKHCKNVKELIAYGQSLGKKYVNYTTSFIPALVEISSENVNEE